MNKLLIGLLIFIPFTSCKKNSGEEEIKHSEFIQTYSSIVYKNYSDALVKATELQVALISFTNTPSKSSHEAAKHAWIDARASYLLSEAYRMYGGPIDDDQGPEGRLNGWPLDEAYIDYVEGNPTSGIINNTSDYPELSKEVLSSLNELGGETNLSTGFHAIEFLLWGQDLNIPIGSAGQRPYTDYIVTSSVEGMNAERRKQYLLSITELLIEDLNFLKEAWKPNSDNFRKSFSEEPTIALRKIVQALKDFTGTELAGERMAVAYETQNQEDEHSCFSDNTHNDHYYDFIGVKNVYEGTYTSLDGSIISGTGISALVKKKKPELDLEVNMLISEINTCLLNIQPPFDEAIKNSEQRVIISDAITKLELLSEKFLEVYDVIKE